jgi:DNA mismatch endonuclease, patch repair protein
MALIRHKDTKPEKLVRSFVHRLGFRFRLHGKGLPGRPDIVLRRHKAVIEVRGCFWHRHPGCRLASMPKSRRDFWATKLRANRLRDLRNERELRAQGWRVLIIWQCQTRDNAALTKRLRNFLNDRH